MNTWYRTYWSCPYSNTDEHDLMVEYCGERLDSAKKAYRRFKKEHPDISCYIEYFGWENGEAVHGYVEEDGGRCKDLSIRH